MNQLKIYLPPPTNWQDFQSLVEEIASIRYDPATVVPYGSQGQRQNGVDVYAEDSFGKRIGIQCKETKNNLTLATVEAEADEAKSFQKGLDLFIVTTTARSDAILLDKVAALNRKKRYRFQIRVESWDMLVNDINRYAMVLNDCYQSYRQAFVKSDEGQHLECLRVAFNRPAFKDDFLYERNYDDFEGALVETKRLFRTGFARDRWSQIPVVQTVPLDFLPTGTYRKSVMAIEKELEKIYETYIADKKRIGTDGAYATNRAGHFNILRGKLLKRLNRQLSKAGLQPIDYAYA